MATRLVLGLNPSAALRQSTARSTLLVHRNAARLSFHNYRYWAPQISQTTNLAIRKSNVTFWTTISVVCFGFGASEALTPSVLQCDASPDSISSPPPRELDTTPPPSSMVNVRELTFGTVCGVCAGVFIKKGARLVAFCLGGVFVLLQFLGSASLIRVDWRQAGARFENIFYRTDSLGRKSAPTIGSVWNGIIKFLTADFQPRASFIAGLALGIRMG